MLDISESISLNGSNPFNTVGLSSQLEEYRRALESDEVMFAKKDLQMDELKKELRDVEFDRRQKEEAVNALENIREQQVVHLYLIFL